MLYVSSEYARTGLYFPYNDADSTGKDYSGHAHSFEGVIHALLDDPDRFTIAGFEVFYSKQEREMLQAIQSKLLADTKGEVMEVVARYLFRKTYEEERRCT